MEEHQAFLGFDLGEHGAVTLIDRSGAVRPHKLELPKKEKNDPDCALWWQIQVARLLDSVHPLAVAYEAAYGKFKGASHRWILRQEGLLLALCAERDILCVGVPTSTVSKHVRITAEIPTWSKGQRKISLRNAAAKIGWDCSDWSQDEVDAAWVADYIAHQEFETVEES